MNLVNKIIFIFLIFYINVANSQNKFQLIDEFTDQVTGIEKKSENYQVIFRKRAARYHFKNEELAKKFQEFLNSKKKIKVKVDMNEMEIIDGSYL